MRTVYQCTVTHDAECGREELKQHRCYSDRNVNRLIYWLLRHTDGAGGKSQAELAAKNRNLLGGAPAERKSSWKITAVIFV